MVMDSSEVGPTEDVVQALLEYLVDPMLPLKSSARVAPSVSQQQSVAKQMHAVVLLYNYYQRKQHPEIEFIGFESFCKLAVTLKPSLMAHMKLMHRSDYTELNDLENQLSVTEKAIRDACNISLVLDALKDVPSTEEWPISKVAVLLIDSTIENCLLLFSSVTHGVWSVIEKDVDISNISPESTVVGKHVNKRKKINTKPLREEQDTEEASFQQLAFSAVKETTGINRADLVVLESHSVYSLSKEKTAARFYIVQSTRSISEDLRVPIKDAIESLQGALVTKSSGSWMVAPAVEYFHVLPYAGILSDWFARKVFSANLQDLRMENVDVGSSLIENPCDKEVSESKEVFSSSLQNLKVGLGSVVVSSSQRTENPGDNEVIDNRDIFDKKCSFAESIVANISETENPHDNEVVESADRSDKNCTDSCVKEASGANTESLNQKDNNECQQFGLSNSLNGLHNMDIDGTSAVCPQKEDKSKCTRMAVKVYHHQKKRTSSTQSDIKASTGGVKVKAEVADSTLKLSIPECTGEKVDTGNKTCSTISSDQDGMPIGDRALVPYELNAKHLEKVQFTVAAKENALSQTPLRVLLKKGEKLAEVADSTLKSSIPECTGEMVDTGNKTCSTISSDQDGMPIGDRALVPYEVNMEHLEKLQFSMAAKENELSQTALRVLLKKREKLSYQLRNMEDEIAVCDKNIQTILDGREDDLAIKLDAIMDCCNEVCLQGKTQAQDGTYQHVEDPGSLQIVTGKSSSEAIITLQTPSQELDNICHEKKWTLPTYRVLPADGGFLANVTVKGMNFECSGGSDLHPSPRDARESAAAQMIAKLQGIAGQTL